MGNVLTDARIAIADALGEVLPDRVTVMPRTEVVGPAMWVELPSVRADRAPGTKGILAEFPVWITADGADRAQVAFLEDCLARVIDRLDRMASTWFVRANPAPTEAGASRAIVLTVLHIAGRGLCLPDTPDASPIPPDPVPITPTPDPEPEPDPQSEED